MPTYKVTVTNTSNESLEYEILANSARDAELDAEAYFSTDTRIFNHKVQSSSAVESHD